MAEKEQLLLVNEFHPRTIAVLDERYQTHKLWLQDSDAKKELIESLQPHCTAAATASWMCDPIVYELRNLKIISCFGVGVDGIDFTKTNAKGISVTNTPDVLNDAVADIAIALILGCTRKTVLADQYVRTGQWQSGPFPFGSSLAGKTLGIAGLGRIGEEIAQRAQAFKMDIAYYNRSKKALDYRYCSSLGELAQASDVLLCMLPGGAATARMMNREVFAALGPNGYFVNVGRGSSVDEADLAHALQEGLIAGAGLDVYEKEPNVPTSLLSQPNVVLFPHIGSATVETRDAMGQLVIDNLAAYFANEAPLTLV